MLGIEGIPADHDTQSCYLGPTLSYVSICQFYHDNYIAAIPDTGVICAPVIDVTKYFLRELLHR